MEYNQAMYMAIFTNKYLKNITFAEYPRNGDTVFINPIKGELNE